MEFDKTKSCLDCPDRKIGCHGTCEGYLERCKRNEELKAKRFHEGVLKGFDMERVYRIMKHRYQKK